MKITREQLKGIVGEVLQEESDYQDYFKAMLKKHNVTSPAQFKSDDERKDFFNAVEAGWDKVHERIKEIRETQAARVKEMKLKEAEEAQRLKEEEEAKAKEIAEVNDKIDNAIKALESLRPVAEEEDMVQSNDIKEKKMKAWKEAKLREKKMKEGWKESKLGERKYKEARGY